MDVDQSLGLGEGDSALDFQENASGTKTATRMRYEAEIRVIRAQIGGLEDIRTKLGLSRRKMCQLLMVDPSAWTRWCRDEGKVPPHVFRALEWFMALNQKAYTDPAISSYLRRRFDAGTSQNDESVRRLTEECERLSHQVRMQSRVAGFMMAAIAALAASLAFVVI